MLDEPYEGENNDISQPKEWSCYSLNWQRGITATNLKHYHETFVSLHFHHSLHQAFSSANSILTKRSLFVKKTGYYSIINRALSYFNIP